MSWSVYFTDDSVLAVVVVCAEHRIIGLEMTTRHIVHFGLLFESAFSELFEDFSRFGFGWLLGQFSYIVLILRKS